MIFFGATVVYCERSIFGSRQNLFENVENNLFTESKCDLSDLIQDIFASKMHKAEIET